MSLKEFLYQLLSFLAGLGIFILGYNRRLWGLVGDDPIQITLVSFGVAVFVFLFIERITLAYQLRGSEKKVTHTIDAWKGSVPHLNIIQRFHTCDDALIYLSNRLPDAKSTFNTKISRDNIPSGEAAQKKYDKAVKKALREGAHVTDIISKGFEYIGHEFKKYANGKSGKYDFITLQVDVPCFLNFTVLDYENEDSEVVIGWATSQSFGTEQPAFAIRDQKVVEYFRTYHIALRASK